MVETGLIIAAGAGSRLADAKDVPKPLRKVCGLPLIERIILCAARAGLKKIVIVVGFDKEKIISYVENRNWPVQIEFIENPDWKKSNGVSVLCAKNHIHDNFILLMSDHIFEIQTLESLRQAVLGSYAALLAVDSKLDGIFDMDDATKVQTDGVNLVGIGKTLTPFNAVDTGMFLMTPQIFEALEAIGSARGDCSLSDGIRYLSQKGKMGVFDVGGRYWQDVDTPESRRHAEKLLLQSCRKDTDGFVSRRFNRYISLAITGQVVKTPLTPNHITLITFFFTGVPSAYLAAQGGFWSVLFGAVLFKLSSILDGVDGEMAKLTYQSSRFGQWLDTICDNLTYLLFFIGLAIGMNRRYPGDFTKAASAAMLFGLFMVMALAFAYILRNTDSGSMLAIQKELKEEAKTSWIKKLLTKVQFFIKRDFFALFVLAMAALDRAPLILLTTALVTNIGWIVILQSQLRAKKRPAHT